MHVSKYKSHKIALFNSMKKSNIAPISGGHQESRTLQFVHSKEQKALDWNLVDFLAGVLVGLYATPRFDLR